MADIFLASRLGPAGFAKLVVIKRLREELGNLEEGVSYRELLLDEAKLAARLQHPNLVQTFEVGESDGLPYLAMEYLEGQPLDRVLLAAQRAYTAVPVEIVLRVVMDVLAGLDYAHGLVDYDGAPLGVVHRDVSPHNVFWTYHGEIKLVDFGVAKYAYSSVETDAGLIKGKLTYMAPEQALRADSLDCRADLFPAGILLWECLAGRPLMPRNNPAAALHKLLHEPLPSLAGVRPDLDPAIAAICERALQRDPEQRYQCADEMRADLEEVVERLRLPRPDLQGFLLRLFERERDARTRQIQAAMVVEVTGEAYVDLASTAPITASHVSQTLGPRRTARESVAPLHELGVAGALGDRGTRRTTGSLATMNALGMSHIGTGHGAGTLGAARPSTHGGLGGLGSGARATGSFAAVGGPGAGLGGAPRLEPLPAMPGVPQASGDGARGRWFALAASSAAFAVALAGLVLVLREGPPSTSPSSLSSGAQAAAVSAGARTAGARPPSDAKIVLRLCGSNTIGGELAPALVEAFLAYKGAAAIDRSGHAEGRITATLDGKRVAVALEARGTATAFAGLAAGTCDIGMASRAIDDAEVAKVISSEAAGLGDLRAPASEHVLALDGIAVIVHPNNPLRSLDRMALREIFSGEITDWSALGVQEAPIHVLARDASSGTFDTFKQLVLGESGLVAGARRFAESDALADAVASDPNAIGFIGLAYVRSAKAIAVAEVGAQPMLPTPFTVATESYLLARRLYLYTPAEPRSPLVAELISYALSPRGQAVVAGAQFVDLGLTLRDEPACDLRCPRAYASLIDGAQRVSVDFRFRSASSEMDSRAVRDLDRLVALLREHPGARLLLLGFSDTGGSVKSNAALSLERARVIESELATRGVRASAVRGFGAALPIASNTGEAGRERNRRVEVWLAR
jgi:phosphate transport system substrate-binding protein